MEVFKESLDQRLLTTLQADHPGLPQVRTLCIRSLEPSDKWDVHEKQRVQVICRLLKTISRHSLTRFEYDTTYSREKHKPTDLHRRVASYFGREAYAGIYFAVRLCQRNICNYQHLNYLGNVFYDGILDWDMVTPAVGELAHVTCLQIFLKAGASEHIDRANSIITQIPALRSLDLDLETSYIDEEEECCQNGVHIVQRTFYSHIENRQATKLKSLRIKFMCLLDVSELLTTVLELKDLKHLQLVHCMDVDPFLRRLEPLRLSLLSLCIENCGRDKSTDFAVNDFIRSLKLLKRFTLQLEDLDNFDSRTLQLHYSSLESLRIPVLDFLCEPSAVAFGPAPGLEQLALSSFKFEEGWLPGGPAELHDLEKLLVSTDSNK